MTSSEAPMAMLFIAFLACFVLVGLIPAWTRTVRRIKAFRYPFAARKTGVETEDKGSGRVDPFTTYEYLVLHKLARAPERMLSSCALASMLFARRLAVREALDSLVERGLVEFARPILINKRYYLSSRGYAFAVGQGFVPDYRAPEEDSRRPVHVRPTDVQTSRAGDGGGL